MKAVKYDDFMQWADDNPVRVTQAGHFPAKIMYVMPENILNALEYLGIESIGPVRGGQCYPYEGADFFLVIICINPEHNGNVIGAVAHECYHAMNYIYREYGARHSLKNDEHGAYLLSHLAYYATKFLEENGYEFAAIPTDFGRSEENSGVVRGGVHKGAPERGIDGPGAPTGPGDCVAKPQPAEILPKLSMKRLRVGQGLRDNATSSVSPESAFIAGILRDPLKPGLDPQYDIIAVDGQRRHISAEALNEEYEPTSNVYILTELVKWIFKGADNERI